MTFLTSILTALLTVFHVAHAMIVKEGTSPEQTAKWAVKSFPQVCEVTVSYGQGNGGTFASGVLISPNSILTAAHVVRAGTMLDQERPPLIDFSPQAGNFDSGYPFRFTSEVVVHPDHQMDKSFYCHGVDLAILKFEDPITTITPVKLWEKEVTENTQGYIVGYGRGGTSEAGVNTAPHIRHMGTTRINRISAAYLSYDFSSDNILEGQVPNMFDSSPEMDKLQSLPIMSDSGGPLLLGKAPNDLSAAGIAHGIVVFNLGGAGFFSAQWIPVAPHLDWINENK